MTITFQKRQKEMKRLEKQRMKEARRAQKKLEKRAREEAEKEGAAVAPNSTEPDTTA
jgi:hypothetical protein